MLDEEATGRHRVPTMNTETAPTDLCPALRGCENALCRTGAHRTTIVVLVFGAM
jgi:hypothetical protein